MVDLARTSVSFSSQREQLHLQPIRSNTISPPTGSIKLHIAKPRPAECKDVTSPLRKETNENDKVDDHDLAQLPKPIYQVHTCKKGVKKALTLDHETQKDQINEEESKEEEKECIGTSSRGRLDKSHLNDQTIESPLKKRKKSSTKIVIS
jgi:hypothetical protein